MSYLRYNIEALEPYVPGEQPIDRGFIKLNTNENPYPPSPQVEAILKDKTLLDALRLYPDPLATELCRQASITFNVPQDHIVAANGSDELLALVVRAFVDREDRVVTFYPSYTLYDVLVKIQGSAAVRVDFPQDFALPYDKMIWDAKVTFLANPNAQTGTFIPAKEIRVFAGRLDGLLVVDEAYVDFAEESALSLVQELPNVIVTRSFSKSYSLAGLRLGLGFGHPNLIRGLLKVKDSYNVDMFAQKIGIAALSDQDYLAKNVKVIRQNREELRSEFQVLGFFVFPSFANFILVKCASSQKALDLFGYLRKQKILVRYFPYPRLDDCLRVTVGASKDNAALIKHVKGFLS